LRSRSPGSCRERFGAGYCEATGGEAEVRTRILSVDDFPYGRLEVKEFGSGKPSVLVTAAIHGGEATGVFAARLLSQYLADVQLSGTVLVVEVSNPQGFRARQRCSPYDALDLNRVFPGKPDGTPTQVMAHQLAALAEEADYVVDLHCCGPHGSPYILGLFRESEGARELAKMLALPVAVQSAGTEGQLFVHVSRQGKPAVIIELPGGGEAGTVDLVAGRRAADAIRGLLVHLGMMPGVRPQSGPQFYGPLERVVAKDSGLFIPQVAPGEVVKGGETLGTIEDRPVIIEKAGVCTVVRPPSFVFVGEGLASFAPQQEVHEEVGC